MRDLTSEELLLAVRNREPNENLRFHLYDGANINYQDSKGISALMEAAVNLDVRTMRFLVSAGATVSLKDSEHKTALHHIYLDNTDHSEEELFSSLEFLLDYTADPNQDCEGNDSLLNWAAKKGYTRIMNLIFTVYDYSRAQDKLWTALTLAEDESKQSTIMLLNDKLDKLGSLCTDSYDNIPLALQYQ